MSAATPEKCPKCHCEMTVECDGRPMHSGRDWHQDEHSFCLERQRDQLTERVNELEDEVADYMKLFCDWKAYATNLESVGRQMLDGGFHAPHIISQWREAENTRP